MAGLAIEQSTSLEALHNPLTMLYFWSRYTTLKFVYDIGTKRNLKVVGHQDDIVNNIST